MPILLRGLLVGALAAMTAPATADEVTSWIEFDKKAGQNPSSPAGGKLLATGTINLPPGHKLVEVKVLFQPRGRGNPRQYQVVKADVNEKTAPVSWTAKANKLDAGEYLVHAEVSAISPDGQTKVFESLDIRRVFIKKPEKLTN